MIGEAVADEAVADEATEVLDLAIDEVAAANGDHQAEVHHIVPINILQLFPKLEQLQANYYVNASAVCAILIHRITSTPQNNLCQ